MYRTRERNDQSKDTRANTDIEAILVLSESLESKRARLKRISLRVNNSDVVLSPKTNKNRISFGDVWSSPPVSSPIAENRIVSPVSSANSDAPITPEQEKRDSIKRIFDSITSDDSGYLQDNTPLKNQEIDVENCRIKLSYDEEKEIEFIDESFSDRNLAESQSFGDDEFNEHCSDRRKRGLLCCRCLGEYLFEKPGRCFAACVVAGVIFIIFLVSLLIPRDEGISKNDTESNISPTMAPIAAPSLSPISETKSSDQPSSFIDFTNAPSPSSAQIESDPSKAPTSFPPPIEDGLQEDLPSSALEESAETQATSNVEKACFTDRYELKLAINLYIKDPNPNTAIAQKYGHPIGTWCVSQITDFSTLFSIEDTDFPDLLREFNEPLDGWNTSSVIKMTSMFYGASSFNQDLSTWNVGKVEDFSALFMGCEAFDQDLGSWDVSSGRLMSSMFANSGNFLGLGLDTWNTSGVEAMEQMFMGASSFDGAIGGWDVSNVKSMGSMFNGATVFNRDLHEWRVSPEMDKISGIFEEAKAFNGRVDGWNIGETKIEKLNSIFLGASSFNQPLNDWDVSKVVNFDKAFASASSFNQSLASWDMSSARTLRSMFSDATSFNGDISNWNLGNAEEIEFMFEGAVNFNRPIGDWNVGSITNMAFAFSDASSFNQDLNQWDTRNVQQMEGLFRRARAFNGLISNWDVANVKQMDVMFFSAFRFNQDLSGWDMSSVERFGGMFAVATSFDQDLCEWTNTLSLPVLSGANDLDRSLDFLFGSDHLTVHPTSSLFHLSGCPAPQNAVYESESFRGPLCRPCGR